MSHKIYVLDTNVLLSALIGKKSRAPSEIYKAFIDNLPINT